MVRILLARFSKYFDTALTLIILGRWVILGTFVMAIFSWIKRKF